MNIMNNIRRSSFSLAFIALASFGLVVAGCGGNDDNQLAMGPYDLTFQGSGFDPHEGQMLHVAVVDLSSQTSVKTGSVLVTDGRFSFTWQALVSEGGDYRIDYFADINGNSECEPSDDHVWTESVSSVSTAVVLEVSHNTNFNFTACASFLSSQQEFDLTFTGTGYGPHEDQVLYVALVRESNGNLIETASKTITGGQFTFMFENALESGHAYRLDFFADVNGNQVCDSNSDHVWSSGIPSVSGAVSVDETHNVNFTPSACDSFQNR